MPTNELVTPLPVPALDASRRWLLAQSALLGLGALLLYWTFERTDLDRRLAHALFDAELGLFPLRHSWFLEAVMHKAAKQATYVLVAASLYVCWQGWRGRLAWLPARNALLAAIGMLAIPLATSTAKLLTALLPLGHHRLRRLRTLSRPVRGRSVGAQGGAVLPGRARVDRLPVDRLGGGTATGRTAGGARRPGGGPARRRHPRHGPHAAGRALPVAHAVDAVAGVGGELDPGGGRARRARLRRSAPRVMRSGCAGAQPLSFSARRRGRSACA